MHYLRLYIRSTYGAKHGKNTDPYNLHFAQCVYQLLVSNLELFSNVNLDFDSICSAFLNVLINVKFYSLNKLISVFLTLTFRHI